MIRLAFGFLGTAALIGVALAICYARGQTADLPPRTVPAVHGTLGASGLAVLLAALARASAPAARTGTRHFAAISAALFALALLLGLAMAWAAWRGRRPPGVLVGAHAGFAIAGLVVLLAVVALG